MNIKINLGRNPEDPEKAILPALIFIKQMYNEKLAGFMIALGWWDFSIKVGFYFPKNYNKI